ncbi:uncharacterized protein C2orf78 homolog [Microtus pennsylvanicus]|uniref:uncharacterized protein C2orf78 homolog n=1 Tax=Microtus pennsylvanicus TaxID=10058 RepID=UPI003F6B8B70
MSENCQSAPFTGTECALQPSVPVLRNATPSAGSVCNFYGVCTPAVSSAWLLSSDSSTCCQQLTDSACLYQRVGTTMLTKPTDQNQISTSTFFYPSVLHWDLRESTTRREAPFLDAPLTVIDQNTTPSSRSITAQCDNTFHINALPPSYPTLSACLVQATPSNLPDQRYILAPCYLHGSQVYYYDQNSLGPPMAEEFWQCQQAYGSVSCSGNQASTLHPEMVMALQEIQPMNIQTPFSTSPIYWPTSAQTMPDTSLQVVEREMTLGLTPSEQTLCLLQSPDLGNACTQDAQMTTAPVSGNRSLTALMHSPSEFLALPPAPSLEKTQKNNADEMNAEQSTPLDSYEGTKCNQDASPLPSAHPGMQQPFNYSDARTHHEDMLKEDDPGTIDNTANHVQSKSQIFVPKRPSVARAQGKEKAKETRENGSKKTQELKPSSHTVKAKEKPAIPKTKRKRNPPELSHDSFKKPRTHLGMHMLESVQVFHPLGKKSERKTGISSSRALLNFSSNKDPRTGPDTTSLLDMPREGQSLDKSLGKIQRPGSSAPKRYPSPSQYELPQPGKVKLVPLPFPVLDKPQTKPVSRKLLCLASRRPTVAYPVRPHSHSAQPPTLKPSQPAPASTSLMASDKPALPNGTSATRANITKPIQSCPGPQPAASLPAPYRASSHTSLHREPLSAASNKALSSPKAKTQYLLLDFSCQPIPWRKVDIPGPVISQPITEEQRPEREAMKRRAQQERENAAKCTSLGKPQLFLQREKDMEISRYYGYAV